MTKRIASAIAVAGASTALLLGTTATPAQAATINGCPSGYVCLYPENAGWNYGKPSQMWYRYGVYKLKEQYGTHYFLNNQTGGAPVWLCRDWDGTDCPNYLPAGMSRAFDFGPINSIKLVPKL